MHSRGRMSQCYINITRNTFIAKKKGKENEKKYTTEKIEQLSRESNLDHLHGRSAAYFKDLYRPFDINMFLNKLSLKKKQTHNDQVLLKVNT